MKFREVILRSLAVKRLDDGWSNRCGAAAAHHSGFSQTATAEQFVDFLVAIRNNGMILFGLKNLVQQAAIGMLFISAVAVSQWRQAHVERDRTTATAQG